MPLLTKCEVTQPSNHKSSEPQVKDDENCLICKLMRIRHERTDVVKWILSSDESKEEKTRLASLMTGIEIDEEVLQCLEEPSIRGFIFSE